METAARNGKHGRSVVWGKGNVLRFDLNECRFLPQRHRIIPYPSRFLTNSRWDCVQGDVDAEWKYARSLLYMEYISEKCAAPVPLNILQHLRDVIVAFVTFLRHRSKDDLDPLPSTLVGNRRRHACYDDASLSDIAEVGYACCGFTV